jgi:hypothetical protein
MLLQEAIISHGCTVKNSNISSAVVGLRSNIEEGCTIDVSQQGAGGGQLRRGTLSAEHHDIWCRLLESITLLHIIKQPILPGLCMR